MQEEEDALYSNNVVREVDRNLVPVDAQILTTLWAYKNKSDEDGSLRSRKSRICVRGCEASKGCIVPEDLLTGRHRSHCQTTSRSVSFSWPCHAASGPRQRLPNSSHQR